mgnify:CR=1 FL=1
MSPFVGEVEHDAAAMVAVERLHRHRVADALRGRHRRVIVNHPGVTITNIGRGVATDVTLSWPTGRGDLDPLLGSVTGPPFAPGSSLNWESACALFGLENWLAP